MSTQLGPPRVTVVNIVDLPTDRRLWPPDHVYIGRVNRSRRVPSSVWRNPFVIEPGRTREDVVAAFENWISVRPRLLARLPELKGKTLVCWCAPLACHGDVLARLVDAP